MLSCSCLSKKKHLQLLSYPHYLGHSDENIFILSYLKTTFSTRKKFPSVSKVVRQIVRLSRLIQTRVYSEHTNLATAGQGQQTTDSWLWLWLGQAKLTIHFSWTVWTHISGAQLSHIQF